MPTKTTTLVSIFTIFGLGACGPTATQELPVEGEQGADAGADPVTPPPSFPDAGVPATGAEICDKMDILFVIDDSGSMGEEQDNLATNFPLFVDVLNAFEPQGVELDYHLGVTTTSVTKNWTIETILQADQDGPDGALIDNGCTMPRKWLERGDAEVESTFSCVAQATGGANAEMPLEAIRMATTDRVFDGANSGFFRDDALLAVVVLTDENDCSRTDNGFNLGLTEDLCSETEPVAHYINALDQVKGDRGRWAAAIIAGTEADSCSSDFGNAQEATRLIDFADQAGPNVVTSSICDGDLASALNHALATFEDACESFPSID